MAKRTKKSWKTPKRYSESINQRTDNIMAKRTKKSWKIPKRESESINHKRTDNIMAKRKRRKGQTTIYNTYT